MTAKALEAQTERNLKALEKFVEKQTMAIGYRFMDIDGCMVSTTDELKRDVNRWIKEQREYMAECVKGGMWQI